MNNTQISSLFNEMASLMELHNESPFKIKSYQNAYQTIRRLDQPIMDMDAKQIKALQGVGEAISSKIEEIKTSSTFAALENFRQLTPLGIRDLLHIRGLGPKKIAAIWRGLGIEEVGELLYAIEENRLTSLPGFGDKTQLDIKSKILFMLDNKGMYLFAALKEKADKLIMLLEKYFPDHKHSLCGDIRRSMPVLSSIDVLTTVDTEIFKSVDFIQLVDSIYKFDEVPVKFHRGNRSSWGKDLALATGGFSYIELRELQEDIDELSFFSKNNLPYILPERRELYDGEQSIERLSVDPILMQDIKGVIHAHSTYSDGSTTLANLAEYCRKQGYQYLGITDHSRSAFYANGLDIDRLYDQFNLIDQLNRDYTDFLIFKGIESDILNDGSLDYPDEILKEFDFIIASVHSNLKMEEEQATRRLIKAIENPYTRILGHPTGRLLLSRKGYPVDMIKIIDASAENGVAIEINANPYRLDLDYKWINYAIDRGVYLSINPDAHNLKGIHDIQWGIYAANKGALPKTQCVSCWDVIDVAKFFNQV